MSPQGTVIQIVGGIVEEVVAPAVLVGGIVEIYKSCISNATSHTKK